MARRASSRAGDREDIASWAKRIRETRIVRRPDKRPIEKDLVHGGKATGTGEPDERRAVQERHSADQVLGGMWIPSVAKR